MHAVQEASLTATQQELLSAKQQLQDVQAAAQPLVQADAASTDGAAGVSVALQQRDAAVAAEVAAVTRAQASEVCHGTCPASCPLNADYSTGLLDLIDQGSIRGKVRYVWAHRDDRVVASGQHICSLLCRARG